MTVAGDGSLARLLRLAQAWLELASTSSGTLCLDEEIGFQIPR